MFMSWIGVLNNDIIYIFNFFFSELYFCEYNNIFELIFVFFVYYFIDLII